LEQLRQSVARSGLRRLRPLSILLLLLKHLHLHRRLLLCAVLFLQLPLVLNEVGKSPESGHGASYIVNP
jgi:hypothetical protein